jgi:hypothetical protein
MTWKPWTFFAVALAGWMNRQQQGVIEYLRMENRILREKLGQKRLILNDSQKRRLATAAMNLGKDLLCQFGTLFSAGHFVALAPLAGRTQIRRGDRPGRGCRNRAASGRLLHLPLKPSLPSSAVESTSDREAGRRSEFAHGPIKSR